MFDVSDQVPNLLGDSGLVARALDRVVSGLGHSATNLEPNRSNRSWISISESAARCYQSRCEITWKENTKHCSNNLPTIFLNIVVFRSMKVSQNCINYATDKTSERQFNWLKIEKLKRGLKDTLQSKISFAFLNRKKSYVCLLKVKKCNLFSITIIWSID